MRMNKWSAVAVGSALWVACGTAGAQTILGGASPMGKLAQAPDGSVYGTTAYGGDLVAGCQFDRSMPVGCGTVFHIATDGSASTAYTIGPNDGYNPQDVTVGSDGNVYGFISYDNTGANQVQSRFYQVTPSGTFTSLVTPDWSQGYAYNPAPLVQQGAGFLAPGCQFGGKKDPPNGAAVGMLLTTTGALSTFLIKGPNINACYFEGQPTLAQAPPGTTYVLNYSVVTISAADKGKFVTKGIFTIGANTYSISAFSGGYVDASGNIYAPAFYEYGQMDTVQGAVLKISKSGKAKIITNKFPAGEYPEYMVGTSDGTLYGIVSGGPAGSNGALFSVSPAGVLTVAHQFGSVASAPLPCVQGQNEPTWTYALDGADPHGELMVAADGSIWGTTITTWYPTTCGGDVPYPAPNASGTVFQYIPSTGQLIEQVYFNNSSTEARARPAATKTQAAHGNRGPLQHAASR